VNDFLQTQSYSGIVILKSGAMNGLRVPAIGSMNKGAIKEEFMEDLGITQYTSGVGSVYTAANSLEDGL
jgi:hypothetical protein